MSTTLRRTALVMFLASVPLAVHAQSTLPTPAPSPVPSVTSSPSAEADSVAGPARVHLHRPGTDIDADTLVGNGKNETYTLTGNVVLHSDPKVDTAFAATESNEPLTLKADTLDIDRRALTYSAMGHVHFTQGTRDGTADTATLDEKSHDIDLVGHARVTDGLQRLSSDRMHYNTLDRKVHGAGHVEIVAPIPTAAPGASKPSPPPKKKRLIPI